MMAKTPAYKNVGFAQVLDFSDLVGAEVQKKRLRDEQVKKTISDVASIDLSGVREASIDGVTAMHQDLFKYVAENANELNDPMKNPNSWKDFMSKKHQLLQAVTLDKQLGARATENAKLFAEQDEYGVRSSTNRAIISSQINAPAAVKGEDGIYTMNPDASELLNKMLYRGADLSAYVLDNVKLKKKKLGESSKGEYDNEGNFMGKVLDVDYGASEEDARTEVRRLLTAPGGAFALASEVEATYPGVMARLGNPEGISIDDLLNSEDEGIRNIGGRVLDDYTTVAMATVEDEMKRNIISSKKEGGSGADKGVKFVDFDKMVQGVGFKFTDPTLGDLETENIVHDMGDGTEVVFLRTSRVSSDGKASPVSYPLYKMKVEQLEDGRKRRTREPLNAEEFASLRPALNNQIPKLMNEVGANTLEMALQRYYDNQMTGTTGSKMNADVYLRESGVDSFTEILENQIGQHYSSGKEWNDNGMISTTSGQINVKFGLGNETKNVSFERFSDTAANNKFVDVLTKGIEAYKATGSKEGDVIKGPNKYLIPITVQVQGKELTLNASVSTGDDSELELYIPGQNDVPGSSAQAFEATASPKADGSGYEIEKAVKSMSAYLMNSIGKYAKGASRFNPKDFSSTTTASSGGTPR